MWYGCVILDSNSIDRLNYNQPLFYLQDSTNEVGYMKSDQDHDVLFEQPKKKKGKKDKKSKAKEDQPCASSRKR